MLYRELAVRRMLRWADAGVTEDPVGSNWGGKVKVFLSRIGLGPNPWCQAGLYSAFKLSGLEIIKTGLVSAFWRWAEPRGWTYRRDRIHPARGDAIVFEWDGWLGKWGSGDVLDHVGLVVKVEDGWVHTVECNKRDAVRLDRYRIGDSRIYGYVRVPGRRRDEPRGRAPVPRLVKFAGRYAVVEGDKEIGRGRLRPMRALWRERYKMGEPGVGGAEQEVVDRGGNGFPGGVRVSAGCRRGWCCERDELGCCAWRCPDRR